MSVHGIFFQVERVGENLGAEKVPTLKIPKQKFYSDDGTDDEEDEVDATIPEFDEKNYDFVLFAHRFVIGNRLPYYEVLLSSDFKESSNFVRITPSKLSRTSLSSLSVNASFPLLVTANIEDDKADSAAEATTVGSRSGVFNGYDNSRIGVEIDISGLIEDGIDIRTFQMVLLYAYTGQFRFSYEETDTDIDLNHIMRVLVASNRLGFTTLTMQCERILSLHLGDFFPHNAQNCLEFAIDYNIPRLERQCREILRKRKV